MNVASPDSTARLRASLNPLLTASLGQHHGGGSNSNSNIMTGSSSNPPSALSMSSYSTAQTPLSAIQPYNPQEWVSSPVAGCNRRRVPLAEPQTGSPPPPPPYSPPRSQRPTSMSFEPREQGNMTPPVTSNASFPPTSRSRPASGDRRFGLSSLYRRRDSDVSVPAAIETPSLAAHVSVTNPQSLVSFPSTTQVPQIATTNFPPGARRAVSTPANPTATFARSRSSSQVRWESGMPLPPPPPGPPPTSSLSATSTSIRVVSPPSRRQPPSGVSALGPVPPTPADWIYHGDSGSRGRSPVPVPLTTDFSSHADAESSLQRPASSATRNGHSLSRQPAVRSDKTLRERRTESRTRTSRADGLLNDIVIPPTSTRLAAQRATPSHSQRGEDVPAEAAGPEAFKSTEDPVAVPRALGSTPPAIHGPTRFTTPPPLRQPRNRSVSGSQTRCTPAPATPPSSSAELTVIRDTLISQTADEFCRGTIERFQEFAHREASARCDAERVRLFAEFIVNESRVRRERYSQAIGSLGSEIFDLSRDLFRPMRSPKQVTESTNHISGVSNPTPTSAETRTTPRPDDDPAPSKYMARTAPVDTLSQPHSAPASTGPRLPPLLNLPTNQNWQSSMYIPSLSPIQSLSVSDAFTERNSRGRPPSRWWESDSQGAAPIMRIERTKRESKYMCVPKEAREALQWTDDTSASRDDVPRDPEKRSLQALEQEHTPRQHLNPLESRDHASSGSQLPSPHPAALMDVSRLVTLPPPYPRHHPAVKNSHPELADIRNAARSVGDLSEVEATKKRFYEASAKLRAEAEDEASRRRQGVRKNLQQQINAGLLEYAEAAEIEAQMKADEIHHQKEVEKKDLDLFQNTVVVPLNDLLTDRIARATQLFDELGSRLVVETREPSPNVPQEEGDEQPELLEKLTLLKWIFEAREALHRAIHDLLSDRNNRYQQMMMIPYRLANDTEKMASATAYFAEDTAKRELTLAEECLERTRKFRTVVEAHVVRGVEVQLSAFWDLAPPLCRVLEGIPPDLRGFQIHIPPAERAENPAYQDHPLQYLFTLLLHAEKSTYQFIESQTNLLCLMHEVNEAVVCARANVIDRAGQPDDKVTAMRVSETNVLTRDLKEKVRVVQDQWESAFGQCVAGMKERIRGWLLETGGWDESLEVESVSQSA